MRTIQFYTIHSKGGLTAEISNLGAKITKLLVADGQGKVRDVVLGFKTVEEWRTQELSFNAICGRVANRIQGGRFSLDGKQYQLPVNNGGNCLHGGIEGFNAKIWEVTAQSRHEITLCYRSKDGEEGFPGNVSVWVTYTVTNENALRIHYEAVTDAPTIIMLTNHAYFNLSGEGSGCVYDHLLQIHADHYTPFDTTACPTGEVLPVEGTMMDFRQPVRIGDRIHEACFAAERGINNHWCLCEADAPKQMRLAATLQADGLTMECRTTMKGMQVYTGNYIENHEGKSGTIYAMHHAVCLEAQGWPDAIHHSRFPSIVLRPGEKMEERTEYQFIVKS